MNICRIIQWKEKMMLNKYQKKLRDKGFNYYVWNCWEAINSKSEEEMKDAAFSAVNDMRNFLGVYFTAQEFERNLKLLNKLA